MATEIKKYTDEQLRPFRKMGEIRLLYATQNAEDMVSLMDSAKYVGIGLEAVTELIKFGLDKQGKQPNKGL